MKYFFRKLQGLLFLVCLYSFADLSALQLYQKQQAKIYFNVHELEISDNTIYVHQGDNLIETNAIYSDQAGMYFFENDITKTETAYEKKWKCPYCFHWWEYGQKCQNPECPSNKWK